MHEQEYGKSLERLILYSLFYHIADKNFQKHNSYLDGIERHRVVLALLWPIMFVGGFVCRTLKGIK